MAGIFLAILSLLLAILIILRLKTDKPQNCFSCFRCVVNRKGYFDKFQHKKHTKSHNWSRIIKKGPTSNSNFSESIVLSCFNNSKRIFKRLNFNFSKKTLFQVAQSPVLIWNSQSKENKRNKVIIDIY